MSTYAPLIANPADLTTVLQVADAEDLSVLADYITDNGAGRLSLDSGINKQLSACNKHQIFTLDDRNLIAKEILLFGGNTVANIYRSIFGSDATISYLELVQDVAKKAGANISKCNSVPEVEQAILFRYFTQAYDQMSAEERKQTLDELGIASMEAMFTAGKSAAAGRLASIVMSKGSLRFAAMVANVLSQQLIGRAAIGSAGFMAQRLTVLAGPVGIAVAAMWTLGDLSSPACRVTLPCVVQVAYMRQKYLAVLNANSCGSCSAENGHEAKFCNECGAALARS